MRFFSLSVESLVTRISEDTGVVSSKVETNKFLVQAESIDESLMVAHRDIIRHMTDADIKNAARTSIVEVHGDHEGDPFKIKVGYYIDHPTKNKKKVVFEYVVLYARDSKDANSKMLELLSDMDSDSYRIHSLATTDVDGVIMHDGSAYGIGVFEKSKELQNMTANMEED